MKPIPYKTAFFLLTCKADQEKKSSGFQRFIIKWKRDCFISVSYTHLIDINTDFKNGYKTRTDASSRMSADQISDVALSLEYVKQYGEAHKELNYKQVYLLEQCVVWQRLSVHLGWQCDNVRASYDEIPKATQDEVFSGAKAFVKENRGRYECGGYIYSGEGQELSLIHI